MTASVFNRLSLVSVLALLAASCGSGGDDSEEAAAGEKATSQTGSGNTRADKQTTASAGNVADMIASFADIDADILGVRLGMTPQEAYAALKEARPDAPLSMPNYVSMTSQGQQVSPDAPGAYIQGININDPIEKVIVTFARPPADNVVTAIERSQSYTITSDKSSADVYRDALIDKYGQPDEAPVWNDLLYHSKWLYPSNAKDCNPLETSLPGNHYKNWRTDPKNMRHRPEQCATALIYTLTVNNGVVDRVNVKIGNAGVIRLTRDAHVALREELAEQAAAAERDAATNEPDL